MYSAFRTNAIKHSCSSGVAAHTRPSATGPLIKLERLTERMPSLQRGAEHVLRLVAPGLEIDERVQQLASNGEVIVRVQLADECGGAFVERIAVPCQRDRKSRGQRRRGHGRGKSRAEQSRAEHSALRTQRGARHMRGLCVGYQTGRPTAAG